MTFRLSLGFGSLGLGNDFHAIVFEVMALIFPPNKFRGLILRVGTDFHAIVDEVLTLALPLKKVRGLSLGFRALGFGN